LSAENINVRDKISTIEEDLDGENLASAISTNRKAMNS
jgi:hypothetical protein